MYNHQIIITEHVMFRWPDL